MVQKNWKTRISKNIAYTLEQIDPNQIKRLTEKILSAQRIFLFGKGRTGLVVQMFAMRLTQLGLPVFIISHPATPALIAEDLLILVSGSGETKGILSSADQANKIGADLIVITRESHSSLSQRTKHKLVVPIRIDKKQNFVSSKVLTGTFFEQSLLAILDLVIVQLLELSGQSYQDMDQRHANLE